MPAHDWTRVNAGIFHDFHVAWIAELIRTLNNGLLPGDIYAMAEERSRKCDPDLFYLEQQESQVGADNESAAGEDAGSGTALAAVPPIAHAIGEVDEASLHALSEASLYALKRSTVTIRHATNDRIVALLEIASPGNKDRPQSVQRFVDKAVAALQSGYHLVVVDLLPPGPSDPEGLGDAVWEEIGGRRLAWPTAGPLSAAAFRVADRVRCYATSFSVGQVVPEVPLFYDPDWYVNLPLETTYTAACAGVPRRWRRMIEA